MHIPTHSSMDYLAQHVANILINIIVCLCRTFTSHGALLGLLENGHVISNSMDMHACLLSRLFQHAHLTGMHMCGRRQHPKHARLCTRQPTQSITLTATCSLLQQLI